MFDPFTAFVMASYALYNATRSSPTPPATPNLLQPSPEPAKELYEFTNMQNDLYNKLSAKWYGGRTYDRDLDMNIGSRTGTYNRGDGEEFTGITDQLLPWAPGIRDYVQDETGMTDEETEDWDTENALPFLRDYRIGRTDPTKRNAVTYTGTKPANKYLAQQMNIINKSQKNFGEDLANYMGQRGMDEGEIKSAVQGATTESNKNLAQRALEVNAKSHDIYSATLNNILGGLSPSGPAAAQLAASIGQQNQAFNQSMINNANAINQQWAWNQQNQTQNGWGAALGQLLPMLGMMFGGSGGQTGGSSAFGPYASGYQFPGGSPYGPYQGGYQYPNDIYWRP